MAHYDEIFPAEAVDEQIEQTSSLPSEDADLVHALRQMYQLDANKNVQSLNHAWQRIQLLQSQALSSQGTYSPPEIHAQEAYVPNDWQRKRHLPVHMTTSRPGKLRGSSHQLSAAAAVVFLALLVGSMAYVFAMARHEGKSATPAQQNTTTRAHTPTPTPGIYVTSRMDENTSQISRLDKKSQKVLWSYEGGQSISSVVVVGNTVYFTGSEGPQLNDNYVYALNASNGVLRWRSDLVSHYIEQTPTPTIVQPTPMPPFSGNSPVLIYPGLLTSPAATSDAVYVIARDGTVYALSSANGKTLWTYNTSLIASVDGTIYNPGNVAVANGIVYITIHNGLFALDAKKGALVWSAQTDTTQIFSSPLVIDGAVYLSSYEISHHMEGQSQTGAIYAYDAKRGRQNWQHPVDNWVLSSPTVANGFVYFGSYDTNVYALKASDGREVWHYGTTGQVLQSPLVSNGIVYAQEEGDANEGTGSPGTVKPALFAIDATSGLKLWSQQINASLLAAQNGILYVSKNQPGLYALKGSDGSTFWVRLYVHDPTNKAGLAGDVISQITVVP